MNISIKKIGILVLFMVSIFILSGCEFLTSQSTITSIEVEATTLEDSYDIDTFELSSISIKVSFSDGKFQLIPITEAMLSSEHLALLSNVGEHEITITYEGKTTSVTLRLINNEVKAQLMAIYTLATTEGGFTGTYEEWLESIHGEDGLDIKSALINNEGHLILTLSDDSTIDAGKVVPEDAKEVEFQTSETHIQWRYAGDETWVDLITLESLKGLKGDAGVDGKEVELQTSETHIQWRYVGEETWVDLVLLSSLIGPKGEQGISITDTAINELGELVVTYSDDTTKNLGAVVRIYLVSFKDDNGYVLDSQLVLHGSSATAPSAPSKEGHTFKSWDKEFTNVTSNLEVKATYDVNSYQVMFKDGETVLKEETVLYGASATSPVAPEKTGYTFTGWSQDYSKVTSSLSIEANYVIKSYQVVFTDDNGLVLKIEDVTHGSSATAPSAPSKEGYTFKSWDKEFANVISNLEVKATYDVNSYQVMFKDGETVLKEETVLYGASATSPVAPEKTGYTFTGWSQDFSKVTSSLTIEATYAIKSYQVVFTDDNGLVLKIEDVTHGSSATAPSAPSKEGYTFKSWDKEFANVISNLEVKATYDVNKYSVSFNSQGGSTHDSLVDVEYGSVITLPVPTKEGYDFTGWYQSDTLNASPFYEDTKVLNDLVLYARWQIKSHKVRFVDFDNNGEYIIEEQQVIRNENIVEPENPIKEGYTFAGWYLGEEKWSFIGYSVTSDITLVAKWIENIDFNIEGATLESNVYHLSVDNNVTSINFKQIVQSNQTWYLSKDINGTSINITKVGPLEVGDNTLYIIEEDENDYIVHEVTVRRLPMYTVTFITNSDAILESIEIQEGSLIGTIPTITKEGYAFDKWDYDFTIPVTSDITLTASWIFIIEYSITYHLDGGVNSVNNPDKYSNISDTIILEDATKTGFTFLGWYSEETFISKVTKIEQGSTNDITLYARFAAETYTLHFVTNGGSGVSDITEEYGKEISVSTIKEGYSFVGWYKDSSLSFASFYELGSTMPAENLTLYAKWQPITYSITYVMNEYTTNDASNPTTYNVTSNITLIDPSVIGGTFICWFTDEDYTNEIENISNMTGNITLYAKVEMNQYTMTFVTNGGTEISPITQDYDTAIHVSTTKEGYMFEAWCSDEGLTTSIDISKMPNANLTVYAKWAQMYEYFTIDNLTYVYYGTYPQTVVSDSALISSLNSLTSTNANGYYEFEGEEYAKVVANPRDSAYKFINGETITNGATYYFKVEPIKWRVLEEADGTYTLLSEYIIDKQVFYTSSDNRTIGDQTIYANNYEHSTIREWLNNAFYNKAFTAPEKGGILTTLVDNSASTTGSSTNPYFSNNTMDKVYLLSYQEATSSTYGFSESSTRTAITTDYARTVGAYMYTSTSYYGKSYWGLRTPHLYNSISALIVDLDGSINYCGVSYSNLGARPAIKIG